MFGGGRRSKNDVRDRTAEFFATVESLKKGGAAVASPPSSSSTAPLLNSATSSFVSSSGSSSSSESSTLKARSKFSAAAAQIGRGIFEVSAKLEKLATMARARSLFEDNTEKINEITYIIKTDINTLNNEIDLLAKFVAGEVGGPSGRDAKQNSDAIVNNLKTQLAHTTKSFAKVLQVRTKNLKEQNNRRKKFEGDSRSGISSRPPIRRTRDFSAMLMPEEEKKSDGSADTVIDITTSAANQQMEVIEQDTYVLSRAQAVEDIEKIIVELGQMYTRLVNIVAMQEEMTIRIDENITTSLQNVESGHGELLKYFDKLSSNQWLILKIFAVLIAFSVFFVVFVV